MMFALTRKTMFACGETALRDPSFAFVGQSPPKPPSPKGKAYAEVRPGAP